jgi:type VI secretion system secreted protein Hcp
VSDALTASPAQGASGQPAPGRAQFQDLSLVKLIDKASPLLRAFGATGRGIPSATVVVLRPRERGARFRWDLENLFVTSVALESGPGNLRETVSLTFGKVKWTYTPHDASGAPGTPVTGCFDISQQREC